MKKELEKQLEKTGTAEISKGVVTQVTQALNETDTSAEMMVFGELKRFGLKPIDECCAKCDFHTKRGKSIKECQDFQSVDAKARGFTKVICPKQFID